MNGSALSASDLTSLARSSMNSSMQIRQKSMMAASIVKSRKLVGRTVSDRLHLKV